MSFAPQQQRSSEGVVLVICRMRFLSPLTAIVLFLSALCFAQSTSTPSQSWISVGPDGGDVRSLSADPANPSRVLLGTSAGQIYQSEDAGKTWQRFVRIGKGNDYVVDHIIFDPKQTGVIYVAAWTLESEGGSVFKSTDNGQNWQPLSSLEGKSVRSMAMAESDPNILIAGTLDGVYRTRNAGQTWQRISPEGSAEIRNIESIAIDPANPDVIYAGTWHLPWKTSDGGKSWHNIKNGIIDDSDVFSIIIDHKQPDIVYASACSGIYKSESAGELFHKIQGIPFSARRTRVLKQDPSNSNAVYAGTTEGLWKTIDAGKTWHRITSPEVIVNDVLVDVRNPEHTLLATDRSGVLASNNSGVTFEASNTGFAHRQVAAVAIDPEEPNKLYAGLINDKRYGGVFVSHDQGSHWRQINAGLEGRDVFALRPSGTSLIAGTSSGVFVLGKTKAMKAPSAGAEQWHPSDRIANENLVIVRKATKKQKAITRKVIKPGVLKGRVTDIELDGKKWLVASSQGLFTSANMGRTWQGGPVLGHTDVSLVRVSPKLMVAVSRNALLISADRGETWTEAKLPSVIASIRDIAFSNDGSIWLACREGLYRSKDDGATWEREMKLPVVNLASVYHDRDGKHMLVTAMNSTEVFSSDDDGQSWQHRDSGWLLRSITQHAGHLLASTAFDGVVMERSTTESADAGSGASGTVSSVH